MRKARPVPQSTIGNLRFDWQSPRDFDVTVGDSIPVHVEYSPAASAIGSEKPGSEVRFRFLFRGDGISDTGIISVLPQWKQPPLGETPEDWAQGYARTVYLNRILKKDRREREAKKRKTKKVDAIETEEYHRLSRAEVVDQFRGEELTDSQLEYWQEHADEYICLQNQLQEMEQQSKKNKNRKNHQLFEQMALRQSRVWELESGFQSVSGVSMESSTPVYNAVDKPVEKPSTALAQLPLALPGDIPAMPVEVTREPSWDGWVNYGQVLREHQGKLDTHIKNYQLVLGRWAAYGIDHWQRPAERKIKELGFSQGTLYNFASVARRIPESLQDDALTFEHYRVLATLPESERAEWAVRAKAEDLSGRELRKRIANTRHNGNGNGNGNGRHTQPSLSAEMDAPARGRGVIASLPLEDLIADWTAGAERLIQRGDEMSRAQADCYLDCAANLRKALGR